MSWQLAVGSDERFQVIAIAKPRAIRPSEPKRASPSPRRRGTSDGGKAAAIEPGTMKRMVAESTSTLNESYVEPSPYAWLRTCAPVPTTYAPACEPLYPFQEILENRTSRARGRTGYCAEAVERKYLICIEIWQVELESCVWRVSFHKYAYVHGDPIQGIDPTGEMIGWLIGIGGAALLIGGAAIWFGSVNDAAYQTTGGSYFPSFEYPLGDEEGSYGAGTYLHQIKPNAGMDDWDTLRRGCVGLLRIRLGKLSVNNGFMDNGGNEPYRQVPGTRGFKSFEAAEREYLAMKRQGKSPWLYAVQAQQSWRQPILVQGSRDEIDINTFKMEGSAFNFASMLYLDNSKRVWEDLAGGVNEQTRDGGRFEVHRRPFAANQSHKGLDTSYGVGMEFVNYYMVSPTHDTTLLK